MAVAPGKTADVTVTVTVTDEGRKMLAQFPNGSYVEGFVTLTQVAADATISYDSLVKTLNVHGDARANLARGELRRSGLQRLRDLTRTGAGTA